MDHISKIISEPPSYTTRLLTLIVPLRSITGNRIIRRDMSGRTKHWSILTRLTCKPDGHILAGATSK